MFLFLIVYSNRLRSFAKIVPLIRVIVRRCAVDVGVVSHLVRVRGEVFQSGLAFFCNNKTKINIDTRYQVLRESRDYLRTSNVPISLYLTRPSTFTRAHSPRPTLTTTYIAARCIIGESPFFPPHISISSLHMLFHLFPVIDMRPQRYRGFHFLIRYPCSSLLQ